MLKKRLLKTVPWLLAFGLLILVVRTVPLVDTWAALQQLQWSQISLLIGLNGLILILLNLRWWIILRSQGRYIPFFTLLGYRTATFGVSYFTPGPHFGGEPLQVYLIEREHQTPRVTAVAAMSLDKTLELLVNFTFLLAGVILIIQQRTLGESVGSEAILFAALLFLLPVGYLLAIWTDHAPLARLAALVIRFPLWTRKADWMVRFEQAQQAIDSSEKEMARFCQGAPMAVAAALLVATVAWILMIGEFWLMVSFLGLSLTVMQLVTALTAARIAILLLLPGSIGALEASQAFAFGAMGLNPAIGISASLLIRGRDIILGAIGLWWGSKKVALSRSAIPIDKKRIR